jgi:hypothetical protein
MRRLPKFVRKLLKGGRPLVVNHVLHTPRDSALVAMTTLVTFCHSQTKLTLYSKVLNNMYQNWILILTVNHGSCSEVTYDLTLICV